MPFISVLRNGHASEERRRRRVSEWVCVWEREEKEEKYVERDNKREKVKMRELEEEN